MDMIEKRILIAEDDESSEMLISIIVESYASEVLVARTGHEAVNICRHQPDIDLVLMDIQMPELDGYEATKQIRQFNKDLIIIAQTAFALSGERDKALGVGCNDYISKPIKKELLKEMVYKHLKNKLK